MLSILGLDVDREITEAFTSARVIKFSAATCFEVEVHKIKQLT